MTELTPSIPIAFDASLIAVLASCADAVPWASSRQAVINIVFLSMDPPENSSRILAAHAEDVDLAALRSTTIRTWGFHKEDIGHDVSAVDHSRVARGPLSVCRWCEADSANRSDDGGGTGVPAGLVPALPGYGRGAWGAGFGSSRHFSYSAGTDAVSGLRFGDHHDRCHGDYLECRTLVAKWDLVRCR